MAIDTNVLQLLKYKKYYNRFYELVQDTIYNDVVKFILKSYGDYFKVYERDKIDVEEFYQYFMLHKGKKLDEEAKTTYRCIINQIKKEPPDGVRESFLQRVADARLAKRLTNAIFSYEEGKEIDLAEETATAYEDHKKVCDTFTKEDWVDEDIHDLIKQEMDEDTGIKWRLACMNRNTKPLREGDFCIVAARPDAGKTTFLLSEITYMAAQLPEDKNVIIFNNEGNGKQLKLRVYQAALGCSIEDVHKKAEKGSLAVEYSNAVGRVDKIRIINCHDMGLSQLDRLTAKHNAGIVVYDMLDNVNSTFLSEKAYEKLEGIYKWARIQATKHNCIGIATSQVSAEGEGKKYPSQSMLKDSKTGKQGACDLIVIIGKSDDTQFDSLRFLGTPKNKKKRAGCKSDVHTELMFKPDICRYDDGEE